MKFGIDLGHKCYPDTGAVGIVTEESIIDNVGYKVIQKLKDLGHTVIELRPSSASSVSNSLWKRYTKSDNNNCDMCISIHANCGGGHGVEVFTYGGKEFIEARKVLNNLVNIGFTNRGIKDGSNLAMVKRPQAKAMLIEICFCDSENDVNIYQNNIENIANGIVQGLTGQLASKYKIGWTQDNTGWYYSPDGQTYYNNCWKKIDGYFYYFDNNGYAKKGWFKDEDERWYYLNPAKNNDYPECSMLLGWLKYKDKMCYLSTHYDKEHNIYTGESVKNITLNIDGNWYSFDKDGYLIE